jgi:membrane protease YdiL (CAAX protease family)
MGRQSEPVDSELNRETGTAARRLLAPPAGRIDGARAIFWNERELRAGWRLLLYLVLFLAIGGAESFAAFRLHLPTVSYTNITATGLLVQEVILLCAAFAAAAILGALESRGFGDYGLPGTSMLGRRFWQGFFWGLVMISAMILLIRLLGGFSFGGVALRGPELWGYAAMWGLVFLAVGLFEEFFFRGYTQFTLASGVGFWPAATMISAVFGAWHLGNKGEDIAGAASVFVMGMFFSLTLRRTGNLWFAVGLHASFDWGETFLFSVPNSGIVAAGHLLNSSFHGPAWLTGGTVGPEASVMAFVVVALAAAVFSRVFPAKDPNETLPVPSSPPR